MDRRQLPRGASYGLLSLGLTGCGLNLSGKSDNVQNACPLGGEAAIRIFPS